MKDTIKITVEVSREEPFGSEHGAHKGSRVYKFAEMMGATIGVGDNCPLTMSAVLKEGETASLIAARIEGKLDHICMEALICEKIAKENQSENALR